LKRPVAIIFIFLALFFCFKDIVIFAASLSDAASYVVDFTEEESPDQEDDTDEKDDVKEEWQENLHERLHVVKTSIETTFKNHQINGHYTPYFEICSPPPESV
jgi:hypothetical protein